MGASMAATDDMPEVETRHEHRSLPPPLQPLVRPLLRPAVPVLTALDDGSFTTGEDFRLRGERFGIGRTEGDFLAPSDRTLSGRHAEIRRVENRGRHSWVLIDHAAANGTFVRAKSATFFTDTIVILGGRRFRLVHPFSELATSDRATTTFLDRREVSTDLWPTLTEAGASADALKFQVHDTTVTLGRFGGGSMIEIDDPHLAEHHATIARTSIGAWQIHAGTTENGVWANIRSITLTAHCFFRCGEQFFRFVIP